MIGIVSDTHDDMEAIERAVALFNERKVVQVVHAGDLISPFTVDIFGRLECPFTAVFGNNDGDRLLLRERYGGRIHRQPHVIDLMGKKTVVVHEHHLVGDLAASGTYDIVIYGHTHEPVVRRSGTTLVVNPGKAARLHRGTSTAAIFDVPSMKVEIVPLFGSG